METESVLKLLVELGVVNADQIDSLRESLQKLETQSKEVTDSLDSMEYVPQSWKEIGSAEEEAGRQAAGSELSHRALHTIIHRLNEVIPGAGSALMVLARGYQESSRAAKEGAVANESFILSTGPLAILILAIEAAVTWYHYFKDAAEDAAKSSEEAFKKAQDATKKAIDQMHGYQEAMEKARATADPFSTALGRQNEILNAQVEAQKKVLAALQATELAKASTEEEKAGIKQKYADLESQIDEKSAKDRIQLMDNVVGSIASKEKELQKQLGDLQKEQSEAYRSKDMGTYDQLTGRIGKLQSQIVQLETQKTELQNRATTAADVEGVKEKGNSNLKFAQGDAASAAKGIADTVSKGGDIDQSQQAFLLLFADEMAQRTGALRTDQAFGNAKAAATFIENFFKTQHDPYGQLFNQIHTTLESVAKNQDAVGKMWMAKFAELQKRVTNAPL